MKFNKLSPNLSVKNVAESVHFYEEILGFKLEIAVPDGTTRIENEILDNLEYAYAMVSKDEVYLMFLNEMNFKCDVPALNQVPQGASVLFYIDVENIKKIYTQIKDKVDVVKALETTWYGMQEFYIRDCNNYILGFGEKVHE